MVACHVPVKILDGVSVFFANDQLMFVEILEVVHRRHFVALLRRQCGFHGCEVCSQNFFIRSLPKIKT